MFFDNSPSQQSPQHFEATLPHPGYLVLYRDEIAQLVMKGEGSVGLTCRYLNDHLLSPRVGEGVLPSLIDVAKTVANHTVQLLEHAVDHPPRKTLVEVLPYEGDLHPCSKLVRIAHLLSERLLALGLASDALNVTRPAVDLVQWRSSSFLQAKILLVHGKALSALGQGEEAARAYEQSVESLMHLSLWLQPRSLEPLKYLMEYYAKTGDSHKARDSYEHAELLLEKTWKFGDGAKSKVIQGLHGCAVVDLMNGKISKAEDRFRKALIVAETMDDRDALPNAESALGMFLMEPQVEKYQNACLVLNRALMHMENNLNNFRPRDEVGRIQFIVRTSDQLARAYELTGRPSPAFELRQSISSRFPDSYGASDSGLL